MFDLNGKTALVTGASGAIGGAIARALHAQGATVAVSGTRKDALDAVASTLGSRVHVLLCDLEGHTFDTRLPKNGETRYSGRERGY